MFNEMNMELVHVHEHLFSRNGLSSDRWSTMSGPIAYQHCGNKGSGGRGWTLNRMIYRKKMIWSSF